MNESVYCANCKLIIVAKLTQSNKNGNRGRLFTKCPGCGRFDRHDRNMG